MQMLFSSTCKTTLKIDLQNINPLQDCQLMVQVWNELGPTINTEGK